LWALHTPPSPQTPPPPPPPLPLSCLDMLKFQPHGARPRQVSHHLLTAHPRYVATGYGARAIADIQKDIKRYAQAYSRGGMPGLFFDEGVNWCGPVA